MKSLQSLRGGLGALILLALAGPASAGTDQSQLTVTATVRSGCSLTGGSLAFGDYVSGQPNALDAVGSIHFANCPQAVVTFELDGGTNGSTADRRMSSGASKLRYQIYRNTTRTTVWGMGEEALKTQLLVPQSGQVEVYGRIPGGQIVPAGTYTDTVTITLTF
ncbi:spore coat U domain-containing protein [Geminicoccaceae bacterium 1502E]|nr:spore coat U domain-containing protein [Geminicoccaceae bacterium 1502E]